MTFTSVINLWQPECLKQQMFMLVD